MPAKPTSPLRATSVRLPESMYARIDALAEATGLSQTDIIRMGMLRALELAERDPAELLRIGAVHATVRPAVAPAVQPFAKFANGSPASRLNEESAPPRTLPPRQSVNYKDALKPKTRKSKA